MTKLNTIRAGELARARDPACIPLLEEMLVHAAAEILRLECERDDAQAALREWCINAIRANFLRRLNPTVPPVSYAYAKNMRERRKLRVDRTVLQLAEAIGTISEETTDVEDQDQELFRA
jgi:hypothetical protein